MNNAEVTLLARSAYVAYGRATGNKNYQGLEMPDWDHLPPAIQVAWRTAVLEVVNHIQCVSQVDLSDPSTLLWKVIP